MQKYKYIANIDTDEIIIPQNMTNWLEMMQYVEKLSRDKVDIYMYISDYFCVKLIRIKQVPINSESPPPSPLPNSPWSPP